MLHGGIELSTSAFPSHVKYHALTTCCNGAQRLLLRTNASTLVQKLDAVTLRTALQPVCGTLKSNNARLPWRNRQRVRLLTERLVARAHLGARLLHQTNTARTHILQRFGIFRSSQVSIEFLQNLCYMVVSNFRLRHFQVTLSTTR